MEKVVDFVDVDADQVTAFWRQYGAGQDKWPELPDEQRAEEPGGFAADHPLVEADQQDGAVGEYISKLKAWLGLSEYGAQLRADDELLEFVEDWRYLCGLLLWAFGVEFRPER